MSEGRDLRTRFAMRAMDFAESFRQALGSVRLPPGDYAPELTAPEGPSTGGGVQSVQHVRLVPEQPGLTVLVVASANPRGGTAELRSFDHVDAVHQERFGRPVALHRAEYEGFMRMVKNFFEANQLNVSLAPDPPAATRRPAPLVPTPAPSSSAGVIVAGVLIGLLIAGTAIWLALGHQHPAPPAPPPAEQQQAPR
jgi:hypothetical protein